LKTVIEIVLLDVKPYSENSLWVCFFSKEYGIQNGIIKGGKKKKTKALVLGLYFFTLYRPSSDKLQSIVEIERSCILDAIYSSPSKILVAFFMAESYRSVLGESGSEQALFVLAKKQILSLNKTKNVHSFPLFYLAQLISFLGYTPLETEIKTLLTSGSAEASPTVIASEKTSYSPEIINSTLLLFKEAPHENMILKENKAIFDLIVRYSRHHIPGYRVNKSIDVIRDVLYN